MTVLRSLGESGKEEGVGDAISDLAQVQAKHFS